MRLFRVFVVALLAGCSFSSSYRDELDTWVGRPGGELVAKWGPPTDRLQPDRSTTVLEYRTTYQEAIPGTVTMLPAEGEKGMATHYIPLAVDPAVRSWPCRTQFFLDADGMITDWVYEGDECRAPAGRQEEAADAEP